MVRGLFVSKEKTEVIIFTQSHRVEGEIHLYPSGRLTDFMQAKTEYGFIAVTNAEIYPLGGENPLYSVGFISLNRNFIVMIFPKSEVK